MSYKYKNIGLKVPDNYRDSVSRATGERIREIGVIDIDYSCFKKTLEERLRLKIAKAKK
ncbi:MAG: hypothetical protein ABSA76_13095 [Bacteroidales bacterium]